MTDRIEKAMDLKAPVERVWRALTDPVEFGTWFRVKLDGRFVVGRPTRGHITYPGYEHLIWEATVTAMDEPHRFTFTWHPYAVDPEIDYSGETPTTVTFTLTPRGGGTHLTIVESGFDAILAHRREEAFMRNDGGWSAQAENIRAHVEG